VSESTRLKVLASAQELGYVMNNLAQAMVGAGHRSLALVTSSLEPSWVSDLATGAQDTAAKNAHPFLLALTHGDAKREQQIFASLIEQRVAAVLMTDSAGAEGPSEEKLATYASALASVGAVLVMCGYQFFPTMPQILTVNCDQVGGVRQAVQHLTSKGHRRIAFLGWNRTTTAGQRFLGYSLGMRDAGMAIDPALVIECTDDAVEAHLKSALLLKSTSPPTAIVCFTDNTARGVYRAARDFAIIVPLQIAIVGFDDSPTATDLTPGLTTVSAPYVDLGARAASVALRLVDENQNPELPTELIIRGSTTSE